MQTVLEKKSNPKPVGLISGWVNFCSKPEGNTSDCIIHPDKTGYGPFLQSRTVSVTGLGELLPIREMGIMEVPLYRVHLESELVTGVISSPTTKDAILMRK